MDCKERNAEEIEVFGLEATAKAERQTKTL